MLNVERIIGIAEFEAIRCEWNELLQRSRSNCVFLTHEWLTAWWRHLAEGRKLDIVGARENGKLVGILPVALQPPQYSRMMPRMLEFLGTGVIGSDYLDAIVDPNSESDVLSAFSHHLDVRALMLQFNQLNHASSLAQQLAAMLATRNWFVSVVKTNECPFISLEELTWQSYLAQLGSSQRYNFQRRLRNLEKTDGFRFETKTDLDVVIDLHKKRWAGKTGMSEAFQNAKIVDFHRDFSKLADQRGWLRLLSLWIKDQPIAALYGLRYGSTFYFYQSGLDPAFARHSAGLVMMGLAIKSALEEGATEFDLLHGCEEYKFHWARNRRELGRIEAFPPHVRGAVYRHCIRANRTARRLVRRMLLSPA
jgi:CelD/BcsL family acetyltransferase involved in cellulose biosynthesis